MCSCFCKKSKQGEDQVEESEKLSPEKVSKENRGLAAAGNPGAHAGSHGVSTTTSNDGGTAALAATVAHISAVEGGSSHGHGGDGGGGADG